MARKNNSPEAMSPALIHQAPALKDLLMSFLPPAMEPSDLMADHRDMMMEISMSEVMMPEIMDDEPDMMGAINERRRYDPEKPLIFQSCDMMRDPDTVKRAISEEFPIMMGYLRSRIRKELDAIGIDMAIRTEDPSKVISGQHVHRPDIQELSSAALMSIWKSCRRKKFLHKCFDRFISPVVSAVYTAAKNAVCRRYGAQKENTPQATHENEMGELGELLDIMTSGYSERVVYGSVLDQLVAQEDQQMADSEDGWSSNGDKGMSAIDAGAEVAFKPTIQFKNRINWEGRPLGSQINALISALTD